MTAAEIIAPATGRLRVRLPYQPGGTNYDLLRSVCGKRTRPTYDRGEGAFLVARNHLDRLVPALVRAFGTVDLTRHGRRSTRCVAACLQARGLDCICSCAGLHHGEQEPPFGALHVADSESVGEVYVIPGGTVARTVRLTELTA